MLRHTDMEITVMREEVYPHRFLETGGITCHPGPQKEAPHLVRRQRELGKMWARVFIVRFVGRKRQDSVSGVKIG